MKVYVAVITAFFLSGCASVQEKENAMINKFNGVHLDDFVLLYGTPKMVVLSMLRVMETKFIVLH